MGGFINKCRKIVKWIGDIVQKVVKWFEGAVKAMVDEIVTDFLVKNKQTIIKAENPDKVAKVIGQKKYLQELQKVVEKEEKDLSQNDLDAVNSLFSDEAFNI